ncbi:penicillin-binding protein, partial [Mesorhizobium sp. M8A.F.Ca.ET.142.01.1.1]
HEFMVAAHQGVPVRPLPGTWKSTPSDTIVPDEIPSADASQPPAPPADVGQSQPAAQSQPVAQAPARQARPAQTVDADGFSMPSDSGSTASIKHPGPPGDVGGPKKRR